jgi:type I restriction enzyme R subunit
VDYAFRDGGVAATGTAITRILPPASRFSGGAGHAEQKRTVIERLSGYFERFFGLSAGSALVE